MNSKANTLKKIKVKSAEIPQLFSFTEKEFKEKRKKILLKIKKNFKSKIAIRSSNINEDQKNNSFAGYFKSYLNVNPQNENDVIDKIINVFKSYKNFKNKKNEVIIQKMVSNVTISGVATSCDKDNFSPYYYVNFAKSKDTSKITSGSLNGSTFVYYAKSKLIPKNKYLKKIIILIKELNQTFQDPVDIEFAFSKSKKLYLLQVRKIVKNNNYKNLQKDFSSDFNKLSKKIKKLKKRHYNLFGNTTLFGVMPDWNPAEIIGIKPNNLAISLYRELITDHIWAEDRKKFGYRDLTSHHLLTNFFGTPFVDVRVDFNSWISNELEPNLSEKLANFYIHKFKNNTQFHDKVEFNIIYSCFSLSTKEKLNELLKYNFNKKEIQKISDSLKIITSKSFSILDQSLKDIDKLSKSHDKIMSSKIYDIDKIYWLIEDCKKLGTSCFASIARCAFIANDFINSFVDKGIFSKQERLNFLSSIRTVVSELNNDLLKLNKKEFIIKYGHLRPSTYDINSINYKDGYKFYFSDKNKIKEYKRNIFYFSHRQIEKINKFIYLNKLPFSAESLIKFIKKSISERERAKFYFSKNIDSVFHLIKKIGKRVNLNKNDLGFININSIIDLYYNIDGQNIEQKLQEEIKSNKNIFNHNSLIKLPKNIINDKDIFYFLEKSSKYNFVGNGDVTGKILNLDRNNKNEMNNKIICISSADPGYDYIFTKRIKGLVTMFGGINSHMAIRCSELKIPAAIGVGERMFKDISNAKIARINSVSEKIDIIN